MKIRLSLVLAVGLYAAALAQAQSTTAVEQPTVEQQILPILREQFVAANAHDTDGFMASYAHDSSLVFVFNGTEIRGFDDLHAQHLKWWKNGKSDVVYSEEAPAEFLRLGPETALVTQHLAGHRTGPDGKPSSGAFTLTTIWRRRAEGWRVIYGHESWVPPNPTNPTASQAK